MQKSIGKTKNLTPCKIVTPVNLNLKLGTQDDVVDITHHAILDQIVRPGLVIATTIEYRVEVTSISL